MLHTPDIDKLIEVSLAKGEYAGASLLVLQNRKELYRAVYGEADMERRIPVKEDTIFHLYSMSKPITAVAVMKLQEQGKLDLHAAIGDFLPCFNDMTVWDGTREIPAERKITVWDCLNMTSGIPYPCEELESGRRLDKVFRRLIARREAGETVNTMEWMKAVAEVPLVFQPGEKWMYGFSADVLGAVVEAASGVRFGEFLKKEIFTPLGMKDTGFFVPEENWNRFAVSYENWSSGTLVPFTASHLGEYYRKDVAFESGGAGMVSTIDDYARFAQMLLQGGSFDGIQILKPETVKLMSQNHLEEAQRISYDWESVKGYGYGCLMRCLEDVNAAETCGNAGEFGWDGWTGNYVTINPEKNLVLLFFVQRCGAGFGELTRTVREAVYEALRE